VNRPDRRAIVVARSPALATGGTEGLPGVPPPTLRSRQLDGRHHAPRDGTLDAEAEQCDIAFNARAWVWATHPDARYRDSKRAVELATRASERYEGKDTTILATLAAACAEAGDFDAAVTWQEKVLTMLEDEADRKAGDIRLALYWAKKPYREEPGAR